MYVISVKSYQKNPFVTGGEHVFVDVTMYGYYVIYPSCKSSYSHIYTIPGRGFLTLQSS